MCCSECERARDPSASPRTRASEAEAHAFKLLEQMDRAKRFKNYVRYARDAYDGFQVAADAWEEVGEKSRAGQLRGTARHVMLESFRDSHRHLSHGFYIVTDQEARKFVEEVTRNTKLRMPGRGEFFLVYIGGRRDGKMVELHRLELDPHEREVLGRVRPWVYAITGLGI